MKCSYFPELSAPHVPGSEVKEVSLRSSEKQQLFYLKHWLRLNETEWKKREKVTGFTNTKATKHCFIVIRLWVCACLYVCTGIWAWPVIKSSAQTHKSGPTLTCLPTHAHLFCNVCVRPPPGGWNSAAGLMKFAQISGFLSPETTNRNSQLSKTITINHTLSVHIGLSWQIMLEYTDKLSLAGHGESDLQGHFSSRLHLAAEVHSSGVVRFQWGEEKRTLNTWNELISLQSQKPKCPFCWDTAYSPQEGYTVWIYFSQLGGKGHLGVNHITRHDEVRCDDSLYHESLIHVQPIRSTSYPSIVPSRQSW